MGWFSKDEEKDDGMDVRLIAVARYKKAGDDVYIQLHEGGNSKRTYRKIVAPAGKFSDVEGDKFVAVYAQAWMNGTITLDQIPEKYFLVKEGKVLDDDDDNPDSDVNLDDALIKGMAIT